MNIILTLDSKPEIALEIKWGSNTMLIPSVFTHGYSQSGLVWAKEAVKQQNIKVTQNVLTVINLILKLAP